MIIDTNVYRAFCDGDETVYRELEKSTKATLPLAVIAEIHKAFWAGTKRGQNETMLNQFLEKTGAEILEPSMRTAEYFAELWYFCRQRGRVLSDNDLWIAATAMETGESLLTLDKDFAVFHDYAGLDVIVL